MAENKKAKKKARIQSPDKGPKSVSSQASVKEESKITFPIVGTGTSRRLPPVSYPSQEATELTECAKATADLKKSHEQLRHLTAHLQSLREQERTNIAREIHDELGQSLIALKMGLSRLATRLSNTPGNETIAEQLTAFTGLVSSTIGTAQLICTNLRPPLLDHVGIGAAIEWQCEEFQKRSGVVCKVAVESDVFTVNIDIAIALFRVFQEVLTNVLKHSQATKVEASLKEEDGKIVLEIHDNGVGITEKKMSKRHSFGFFEMRERLHPFGGTISITGKEKSGTTLIAIIPLSGMRAEV